MTTTYDNAHAPSAGDPAEGIGFYATLGADDRRAEAAAHLLQTASTGGDTDGTRPLWRVRSDWACNVLGLNPDDFRARDMETWPPDLRGRVTEPRALIRRIGEVLADPSPH